MTTRCNASPSGGENAVRSIRGERIAVGLLEHLLIAKDLFLARKLAPFGDLTLGRGCRWNKASFVSRSAHPCTIAQQKGPGKTGAFEI